MALNASNIHVGPARIFIGTTAPATGTPPTWAPHTNGLPADGTEVGFTINEAVFSWNTEKQDINAEQTLGIVDQFITAENATLSFEAQERQYTLMKQLFDNIGSVDDVTRMGFYGGGGGTVIEIQYTTVFLSSRIRSLSNKYEVLFLYKCVSVEAMPLRWSRTTPSTYAVNFRCLPDTTRDVGDQIFQFSREK